MSDYLIELNGISKEAIKALRRQLAHLQVQHDIGTICCMKKEVKVDEGIEDMQPDDSIKRCRRRPIDLIEEIKDEDFLPTGLDMLSRRLQTLEEKVQQAKEELHPNNPAIRGGVLKDLQVQLINLGKRINTVEMKVDHHTHTEFLQKDDAPRKDL